MMYYPFFNTDFQDGTLLHYTYYVNGLHDGVTVDFYPSGEVQSYCVYREGKKVEKSYEWYENGMIKWYNNGKQLICFNEKGHITERK